MDSQHGETTDLKIIREAKQRCREQGMDPAVPPSHTQPRLTGEALTARREKYKDYIEVTEMFVRKFLSTGSGNPILITLTDREGFVLDLAGDPAIIETVKQLGVEEGIGYTAEDGPSSVELCLRHERPFRLIGRDHYHQILHRIACYSAPFRSEDGTRIEGTLSLMTGVEYAHPHLLALLCTMADSLEREMVTRKQNAQLQTLNQVLLDTKYQGMIITDGAGRILKMNDYCLKLLCPDDGDRSDYVSRSIFDVPKVNRYYEQVIYRGESCIGAELSMELAGDIHHYMLDVQPVYDREGQLMRVIGTLRDITEMKRTEEVLRNTEKLVFAGQVAVSIAHEVRNPLTTIKGLLQLAHRETNLRYYDLMMSELDRANLIVGEFMILGRPQAVVFKQEDCGEILDEVLQLFQIQAELNGIRMNREIERQAEIRCDRNQIKQVFLNILKNAMEALPFGGNIDVRMDVEGGYQRVTFSDNGTGMTEEVLRRIGEPFHTTKPEGNGLGMMIVHRILETHRGTMRIRSEAGKGTSVEIGLPLSSS